MPESADRWRGELFRRAPGNPIITTEDVPYRVNTVFNPGATMVAGKTLLLLRVEDRRGLSHFTCAQSSDGTNDWRVDDHPAMVPSPLDHPEERWGIEDPRITFVPEEDRWFVAYTAYSEGGPLVALAATEDFRSFERLGAIFPPDDKDAALFPVRFAGRWAMLHRPMPVSSGSADIWISFSGDLRHWGDHTMLIPARRGAWWDCGKVGLSPPPLRTDRGWLLMYHGVRTTAAGTLYRLGLALLDLEDPGRVLRRSSEWVFGPQEDYERSGDVGNVVFPCGWVMAGDEVRLYYGAADTCVAVASASLTELLAWLDADGVDAG